MVDSIYCAYVWSHPAVGVANCHSNTVDDTDNQKEVELLIVPIFCV